MYSTYHLSSAEDLNTNIIEAIKMAFKGKEIVITVAEKESVVDVPEWQQEIVLKRLEYYEKHPEELVEWDTIKSKLNLG